MSYTNPNFMHLSFFFGRNTVDGEEIPKKPPRIERILYTAVDNLGIFIPFQLVRIRRISEPSTMYLKISIQSLTSSLITVQKWAPFFFHATTCKNGAPEAF